MKASEVHVESGYAKLHLFIGALFVTLFMVFFAAVLMGLPTMLLWNWIVPDLLGLPTIGFFKAIGLNFLCGVLFRSTVSTSKE